MHSLATRNEFIRLRIAGMSFARIGRQLGVSKPNLIAWSREALPKIEAATAEADALALKETTMSASQELAELKRRHQVLRQELFSRAFREVPTDHIEALAGQIHKRIEQLESPASGRPLLGEQGRDEGELHDLQSTPK